MSVAHKKHVEPKFHYTQEDDDADLLCEEEKSVKTLLGGEGQRSACTVAHSSGQECNHSCWQPKVKPRISLGKNYTTFQCGHEVLVTMIDTGSDISLITDEAAGRIQNFSGSAPPLHL